MVFPHFFYSLDRKLEFHEVVRHRMNAATQIEPSATEGGKLAVLVVDDHRYFRESLISYLTDFPAVSIAGSAANGAEAVALVEKLRPLLVIMDIQMPEMDGITACRLIKASCPELRVVLYSINAQDNYDKEALERADRFVPKDRLFEELSGLLSHGMRMRGLLQDAKMTANAEEAEFQTTPGDQGKGAALVKKRYSTESKGGKK